MRTYSLAECLLCDNVNDSMTGSVRNLRAAVHNRTCKYCNSTGTIDLDRLKSMQNVRIEYHNNLFGNRVLHLISYDEGFTGRKFIASFNVAHNGDRARPLWQELLRKGFVIHESIKGEYTGKQWSK